MAPHGISAVSCIVRLGQHPSIHLVVLEPTMIDDWRHVAVVTSKERSRGRRCLVTLTAVSTCVEGLRTTIPVAILVASTVMNSPSHHQSGPLHQPQHLPGSGAVGRASASWPGLSHLPRLFPRTVSAPFLGALDPRESAGNAPFTTTRVTTSIVLPGGERHLSLDRPRSRISNLHPRG